MTAIVVRSRAGVESETPRTDADHAFISIRTPADPREVRLPVSPRTAGVLSLSFHDLSQAPELEGPSQSGLSRHELDAASLGVDPGLLFNEEHAERILDFVESMKSKIDVLIIHCDGGLSRSPAVAAALVRTVFGSDDSQLFESHTGLNRRVYDCIVSVYRKRQGGPR